MKINHIGGKQPEYGKILKEYVSANSGDPEKFLTTQHERDQETGLDYRGARYYDSDVARFLSTDPWQKDYPSWSTYNYVMGNPLIFTDPTGKGAESTHIDKNGKVISVIDDGDNGIYQHGDNADGGTPTAFMIGKRQEKYGTSANGTKVGETETWDELKGAGWYNTGGKINAVVGAVAAGGELSSASFRLTNGLYNGSQFSPKWYSSGWTGGSR